MSKKENEQLQEEIATARMNEDDPELANLLKGDGKLSIKYGMSSIIGTRDYQQDTMFAQAFDDKLLAVVCDGMGGLSGGEIASQTATKCLAENFFAEYMECKNKGVQMNYSFFLYNVAKKMDKMVNDLTDESGKFLDCGTTAVAAIIDNDNFYWMSVGDSKIYMIRDGQISSVNREHTVRMVIDEQMQTGTITMAEYEKKAKQAEALVSYVGMGNVKMVDVNETPIKLQENDIVILCSDGLYKRLPDADIAEIIKYDVPDMNRAARHLNEVVMQRTKRSQDNTSIILMQYNKF